jgi:hypothetical protein
MTSFGRKVEGCRRFRLPSPLHRRGAGSSRGRGFCSEGGKPCDRQIRRRSTATFEAAGREAARQVGRGGRGKIGESRAGGKHPATTMPRSRTMSCRNSWRVGERKRARRRGDRDGNAKDGGSHRAVAVSATGGGVLADHEDRERPGTGADLRLRHRGGLAGLQPRGGGRDVPQPRASGRRMAGDREPGRGSHLRSLRALRMREGGGPRPSAGDGGPEYRRPRHPRQEPFHGPPREREETLPLFRPGSGTVFVKEPQTADPSRFFLTPRTSSFRAPSHTGFRVHGR